MHQSELCATLITKETVLRLRRAANRTVAHKIVFDRMQIVIGNRNRFVFFKAFSKLGIQFEYACAGRTGGEINNPVLKERNKKRMKIIVLFANMNADIFLTNGTNCLRILADRYYFRLISEYTYKEHGGPPENLFFSVTQTGKKSMGIRVLWC